MAAENIAPTNQTADGAWMNRSNTPAPVLNSAPAWLKEQASQPSQPSRGFLGNLRERFRRKQKPVEPDVFQRWDEYFKQHPEIATGLNTAPEKKETLISRMGHALENAKPFGKSVADFALHGAATRGLSMGSRELAKGIVSWSGLAGAVGGGVTGTVVAGAFVGAVSGALVEYARQVNKNLDIKAKEDLTLTGKKAAFLLKFKELRHAEVLKPTDLKRIRNAAIFGAIAGAGAGALVEYIPEISEFVRNIPGVSGLRDLAGGIGHTAGEAAGGIGGAIGGVGSGAGEMIGGAAGTASKAAGDFAGGIGGAIGETGGNLGHVIGEGAGGIGEAAHQVPVAGEVADAFGGIGHGIGDAAGGVGGAIGETAGNVGHTLGLGGAHEAAQTAAESAGQVAQEAIPTPDGFVPQADYDDLRRQLAETKQALDTAKGIVPVGAAAAATVQAATEHATNQASIALENLGSNIPLEAGSNPWEVSADILKHMGIKPTPEQIMQLDQVLSSENSISVPEWDIKGTIDAHNLPVGFKLNLTDAVKKAALGIASKK